MVLLVFLQLRWSTNKFFKALSLLLQVKTTPVCVVS